MIKLKTSFRLIAVLLGTALTSFGITLFLKCGYGTDTLSVFLTGVQKHVPLPFGYLSMGFNLLIIVLAFFLQRDLLGIGTIINGFGVGWLVNLYLDWLAQWTPPAPLLLSVVAALCYAVGIGFYVSAQLGAAAIECLTFIIEVRSALSLKMTRILVDAILVVLGLLLGSRDFSIATIICLLLTGPIVEWMFLSLRTRFQSNP